MQDSVKPSSLVPRERIYVDSRIQMWMLIGLVLLETLLASGGVVYLYFRYKAIIEENLYRIHHTSPDIFTLLLAETGWVVLILLGINVLGLLIADRLWVWYVKRVLGTFTALACKVTDLDFRADQESPDQHVAVDLMLAWRQKERSRLMAMRETVRTFDLDASLSTPQRQQQLASQLKQLQTVLPPYSRRYVGRLPSTD